MDFRIDLKVLEGSLRRDVVARMFHFGLSIDKNINDYK
jgi:hypothetical protein